MNPKPIDYRSVKIWIEEQDANNNLSRQNVKVYEGSIIKKALEEKSPCLRCGRTDKQTLDHLVPRSILEQFGIEWDKELLEDNYQILCRACNNLKSNHLDFSNPKTKEILLKLIGNL